MTGQIPGVGMSDGVSRAKSKKFLNFGCQAAISSQGGLKKRFRWVESRFHGIETGSGVSRAIFLNSG